MSTITATTTWTKLRNGSWGIKGRGLTAGRTVSVTKRSGESKQATVGRIIWTGTDGTQIATVATEGTAAHTTAGHRCEECGRRGAHWATDMSGIGGYLCYTCDDGMASFC